MIENLILIALTRYNVFAQVKQLLVQELLPTDTVALAVDFAMSYFNETGNLPTTEEFKLAGIIIPVNEKITDQFIISSIYKHARHAYTENFLQTSVKEFSNEIFDGDTALNEFRKIIQQTTEISVGSMLHKNVRAHVLDAINFVQRPRMSLGLEKVDKRIGGGLGKQELLFYAAPPGRGKTTFLTNVFYNGLLNGWNGLFLSLELSESSIKERFFRRVIYGTRKDLQQVDTSVHDVEKFFKLTESKALLKYSKPNVVTVEMLAEIIYKAQTVEEINFDFICIDYVDKLAPTHAMKRFEIRHQIREMVNDLRNLAVEFDIAIASATQANRESVRNGRVTEMGIAESYAKIEAADIVLAQNMPQMVVEATDSAPDELAPDNFYDDSPKELQVLDRVINILKNRDHPIYEADIPIFIIPDMMLVSDNLNILPLEVFNS